MRNRTIAALLANTARASQGRWSRQRCGRTAAVLGVTVLLACGTRVGDAAPSPAASGQAEASAPAVQQFIREADETCTSYLSARWAVALEVFGALPSTDPSPEQRVAYYERLLSATEDYLSALTALDTPPGAAPVGSRLVEDAYATWLTVVEVLTAHRDGDAPTIARAQARLDQQLNGPDSADGDLRTYDFEVCAA